MNQSLHDSPIKNVLPKSLFLNFEILTTLMSTADEGGTLNDLFQMLEMTIYLAHRYAIFLCSLDVEI